jgi:hypothetical protein
MGSGIQVDSYVKVDDGCPIEYQIAGDQVEFRLGGTYSDGVDLIFTDLALAIMAEKCAEALRRLNQADEEQGNGSPDPST